LRNTRTARDARDLIVSIGFYAERIFAGRKKARLALEPAIQ
jgi:hypothetical protein